MCGDGHLMSKGGMQCNHGTSLKTQGLSTPLRSARDDRCLLVRCDASVRIGTGHAMRCVALAQAWQDAGGDVAFAMAKSTKAVTQRIVGERIEFVQLSQEPDSQVPGSQEIGSQMPGSREPGNRADADRTIELAREHRAQWVVVDGYVFKAEYLDRLHDAGLKLLVVDDDGRAERYHAEIVLNQNPQATEGLYLRREPSTRMLLGPEYVLLRREFAAWRDWERKSQAPERKVLVTMGGSDPENVTPKVIAAVMAASEFEIRVVVGGSNPHVVQLREVCGKSSGNLRLIHDPGNMAELMAWADVAISAAGTAAWEMAFMGLPVLLVVLAENQQPIANALVDAGAALSLGPANALDAQDISHKLRGLTSSLEALEKMSACGRALIDGRGAERVVAAMFGTDFKTMPLLAFRET